jgi:ABC-type multidrug transport system fused ATPase/permease subunit
LKTTTENDNRGVKMQNLSGKLTIVTVAHRLSTLTGYDKLVDLGNEPAVVAETAT